MNIVSGDLGSFLVLGLTQNAGKLSDQEKVKCHILLFQTHTFRAGGLKSPCFCQRTPDRGDFRFANSKRRDLCLVQFSQLCLRLRGGVGGRIRLPQQTGEPIQHLVFTLQISRSGFCYWMITTFMVRWRSCFSPKRTS